VPRPERTGRKIAPPSERGVLAYSVPQAGRLIGLSRNASYEAAARGEIPTMRIGPRRLIVPVVAFERLLASAGAKEKGANRFQADEA
jgi:hypothetical protein